MGWRRGGGRWRRFGRRRNPAWKDCWWYAIWSFRKSTNCVTRYLNFILRFFFFLHVSFSFWNVWCYYLHHILPHLSQGRALSDMTSTPVAEFSESICSTMIKSQDLSATHPAIIYMYIVAHISKIISYKYTLCNAFLKIL